MKTGAVILILCIFNFVGFFVGSMMIGGSAANGFKEDGRYFVSEHGKNTEVTKQIWNYSLWHSRSLLVTHPLAMILMLVLGAKWDEKRKQRIEQAGGGNALPRAPHP